VSSDGHVNVAPPSTRSSHGSSPTTASDASGVASSVHCVSAYTTADATVPLSPHDAVAYVRYPVDEHEPGRITSPLTALAAVHDAAPSRASPRPYTCNATSGALEAMVGGVRVSARTSARARSLVGGMFVVGDGLGMLGERCGSAAATTRRAREPPSGAGSRWCRGARREPGRTQVHDASHPARDHVTAVTSTSLAMSTPCSASLPAPPQPQPRIARAGTVQGGAARRGVHGRGRGGDLSGGGGGRGLASRCVADSVGPTPWGARLCLGAGDAN